MSVNEQVRRFEEVKQKVQKNKEEYDRLKLETDYDKKNLKEKMDELKEKGIDFQNLSDLEGILDEKVKELKEVLDATERKLEEV